MVAVAVAVAVALVVVVVEEQEEGEEDTLLGGFTVSSSSSSLPAIFNSHSLFALVLHNQARATACNGKGSGNGGEMGTTSTGSGSGGSVGMMKLLGGVGRRASLDKEEAIRLIMGVQLSHPSCPVYMLLSGH